MQGHYHQGPLRDGQLIFMKFLNRIKVDHKYCSRHIIDLCSKVYIDITILDTKKSLQSIIELIKIQLKVIRFLNENRFINQLTGY